MVATRSSARGQAARAGGKVASTISRVPAAPASATLAACLETIARRPEVVRGRVDRRTPVMPASRLVYQLGAPRGGGHFCLLTKTWARVMLNEHLPGRNEGALFFCGEGAGTHDHGTDGILELELSPTIFRHGPVRRRVGAPDSGSEGGVYRAARVVSGPV